MREDREPRFLLVLIAGIILGFCAAFFIWLTVGPIPADAADVGLFTTSASGTRVNCTDISSPVAYQTWCFDQGGAIQAYTLTGWATITTGNATASTPQCTNNCGTSATVVGTNASMRVTMGSTGTPRSPFLVLFSGAWNSKPACIAQLDTATTTTVSVTNSTTTGVSVNTVIGPSQGGVFSILCGRGES